MFWIDRKIVVHKDIYTCMSYIEHRQIYGWILIDRQIDIKIDIQTDRQTDTDKLYEKFM